jgi:hypothetical protein
MDPIIPIVRKDLFDDPDWNGFRGIADTFNGNMLSKNKRPLTRFNHLLSVLPTGCIFRR